MVLSNYCFVPWVYCETLEIHEPEFFPSWSLERRDTLRLSEKNSTTCTFNEYGD